MSRIADSFNGLPRGQCAFIPFLPWGYPDRQTWHELVRRLVDAGADILEIGIPFSDPVADGPTIQKASQTALKGGASLKTCLAELGNRHPGIPVVIMSYFNPIHSMGVKTFVSEAALSGVDGVIIPDCPVEESGKIMETCRAGSLDLIMLASPTSGPGRLAAMKKLSSGYLYYVSLLGTTGARHSLAQGLDRQVAAAKRITSLPVAVGFGISDGAAATEVRRFADGVIAGSALIDAVEKGGPEELSRLALELSKACHG